MTSYQEAHKKDDKNIPDTVYKNVYCCGRLYRGIEPNLLHLHLLLQQVSQDHGVIQTVGMEMKKWTPLLTI